VVTNNRVEDTDGPVGDVLQSEDNALTFSELLDREWDFDIVRVYVCNKKVHTIITNLERWLTVILKHPASDIRILVLKARKTNKKDQTDSTVMLKKMHLLLLLLVRLVELSAQKRVCKLQIGLHGWYWSCKHHRLQAIAQCEDMAWRSIQFLPPHHTLILSCYLV
jgi:hypothetical protein